MANELQPFLRMLAGSHPDGRLLEVRYRNPRGPGMRQYFIEATRVDDAATAIQRFARESDTYTGVLLRNRPAGGRSAVSRSHLLFAEIDTPDALRRLLLAPAPPTAVITSGTEGHLHAYWQLEADVSADEVEVGNRKLAGLIGGDLVSVDAARILRPPNTWSYKHQPPVLTHLESLEPEQRYSFNELTAHLGDPAPRRAVAVAWPQSAAIIRLTGPGTVDAHLRAIATEDYVLALTGRHPNGERKIACPFPHHERGREWEASLQLREHGEWNCFGCGTGGTIYDFAAHLWDTGTKGHEFKNLRERLATAFGISGPAARHPRTHAGSERKALTPAGTGSRVADLIAASLER